MSRPVLIGTCAVCLIIMIVMVVVARQANGHAVTAVSWGLTLILFLVLLWSGIFLWYGEGQRREYEKALASKTKALKKSEEKYRNLVESSEDFIFTISKEGTLLSVNSFTANFFGGTPTQFVGEPLSVLFPEEVTVQQLELVNLVFEFGKSVRQEFLITDKAHDTWLSANFMPLRDEKERIKSVLCIARDVTEHKKLEGQLISAEKMASMGTLAAGVAHEINNPLSVILGFIDLLLEKSDKENQDYQDLKTIERNSLHCKQIVENLLSFARQGEGNSEYCDIYDAIHEIVGVVKHFLDMKQIELRVNLVPGLPKVKGDARQMQQVFLNLINNAAGALEGGGILELEAFLDTKRNRVCVVIRDNGHGIKKEDMERIFDPFFTTKPEGEGTGLGLFVSRGIVTKYEGTITCESYTEDRPERPRGTTVTVILKPKGDVAEVSTI
jgi:PAS domain S-box-containing protein